MHYADTTANDNGTITAHCYCGWSGDFADQDTADRAAGWHQNHPIDAQENENGEWIARCEGCGWTETHPDEHAAATAANGHATYDPTR